SDPGEHVEPRTAAGDIPDSAERNFAVRRNELREPYGRVVGSRAAKPVFDELEFEHPIRISPELPARTELSGVGRGRSDRALAGQYVSDRLLRGEFGAAECGARG